MFLVVIGIIAVVFIIDKLPVATVTMAGAIACGLLGLIKYPDVFSGLAGTAAVLLMSMMIVGSSLFYTGLAERLSLAFLKITGTTEAGVIVAVMSLAALFSSICNNVGVVVTLMPIVLDMCKKTKISPSKLMFPLAFGAAVGGAITLVGTASSVTCNGILEKTMNKSLGFLDFAYVGIPLTVLSTIYMGTLGRKLLPDYDINLDDIPEVDRSNVSTKKMWISGIILIIVVLAMAFSPKGMPLYMISSIGALVLILTGCISEKQAFSSISWSTIAIAGGMIAVSGAVTKTGGGKLIADAVVNFLGTGASPYLITGVLLFVVTVMTQFLSNVSTAALMTPIALFIAQGIGANPVSMAMVVALGANASYLTPVGNQAFTVVCEPGHYKFMDYVKIGMPVCIINFIISLVIVPLVWPF